MLDLRIILKYANIQGNMGECGVGGGGVVVCVCLCVCVCGWGGGGGGEEVRRGC